MSNTPWIGVDLDGTLAYYHGWADFKIGDPIPYMQMLVRRWLSEGKDVRILTARAGFPESIPAIKAWCKEHLGRELPVTDKKDFHMVELYDDRAVQVRRNEGTIVGYSLEGNV